MKKGFEILRQEMRHTKNILDILSGIKLDKYTPTFTPRTSKKTRKIVHINQPQQPIFSFWGKDRLECFC